MKWKNLAITLVTSHLAMSAFAQETTLTALTFMGFSIEVKEPASSSFHSIGFGDMGRTQSPLGVDENGAVGGPDWPENAIGMIRENEYHFLVTINQAAPESRYHLNLSRTPLQPLLVALGWSQTFVDNSLPGRARRDRRPYVFGEVDQEFIDGFSGTNLGLTEVLGRLSSLSGCNIVLKYQTVVVESCNGPRATIQGENR